MEWLDLPRIPEPESMDDESEVEACASATALEHLERLDDAFVDEALALGVETGVALDVGTGPGQIPIKLALRTSGMIIHAIDSSRAMLRRAAIDASRWGVDMRILLNHGDAHHLPFDPELFDLVVCNSVLHHVRDPVALIREMGRVVKPSGALLLRDLRRPNRITFSYHLRRHGRHYSGKMLELFEASVRASYTLSELRGMVRQSTVKDLEIRRFGPAHLGFSRRRAQRG